MVDTTAHQPSVSLLARYRTLRATPMDEHLRRRTTCEAEREVDIMADLRNRLVVPPSIESNAPRREGGPAGICR